MLQQSSLLGAGVVALGVVALGVVALGLSVVVFMHLSALRCKYTRVRTESEVKQRKNEHAPQISAELNMRTQP